MKRRMILLMLAVFLLTAGCTADSPNETNTPGTTAEAGFETPGPQEREKREAEANPEDRIPIDASLYSPRDCRFTLLEREDCLVELVVMQSLDLRSSFSLYVHNRTDEQIWITVSDITLNETVQLGGSFYFPLEAGKSGDACVSGTFPQLDEICAMIGYENVTELSANVQIRKDPAYVKMSECSIAFPEGLHPHFAYEAYLDMRADRQVLRADDRVTIALLGCGHFFDTSANNRLTGFLWVENRTDETIPVDLSGLSVNGTVVPMLAGDSLRLRPGTSCLIEFYAEKKAFDTAGISSIASMRLQILTSEEENSGGARLTEGGTWYPVALAESGRTEDAAEEGTLLYDDGLLEVRFLRAELNDSWIEGYVNADYYLLINNRRAEGVRIRIKDAMLGDAPYVDPAWSDDYIFTENDRIGAQSKGVMIVSPRFPKEETENGLPEFSFLLQVRSQGEDTIFYTTAERIRLAEE